MITVGRVQGDKYVYNYLLEIMGNVPKLGAMHMYHIYRSALSPSDMRTRTHAHARAGSTQRCCRCVAR
jgi:hypothetical protein